MSISKVIYFQKNGSEVLKKAIKRNSSRMLRTTHCGIHFCVFQKATDKTVYVVGKYPNQKSKNYLCSIDSFEKAQLSVGEPKYGNKGFSTRQLKKFLNDLVAFYKITDTAFVAFVEKEYGHKI